jgi:hypothetical protein
MGACPSFLLLERNISDNLVIILFQISTTYKMFKLFQSTKPQMDYFNLQLTHTNIINNLIILRWSLR